MKILDFDTFYTNRFIWISTVETRFLDIPTGFRPIKILSFYGAQNFKFPGFWLAVRDSA